MSLINTHIKPFKAQAYKNGKFIEVSEADVKEVIRWADEYAEREGMDRGYTLYLRVDDKYGAGLVKLFGVDPTAG